MYYAVIFRSTRTTTNDGYADTANRMVELAREQSGFLGVESARNDIGITVSYWKDLDSISAWKQNAEHLLAQEKGQTQWYENYIVRIAKVEREYSFGDSGI
ncbi:antibiotic biosynthesis monooxygenase [Flavobacterium sp. SE-s28]|uniref:Antibiotic biosynthesis monooxygenase n=2 Tax=Flavobacterium silvaticum TaxID=1852020 RepID=A0A972FTU1_9FLAO|nr:antibiotic biosynthesis monooxygenase [Flavobacterium silvaticum]